MSDDDTKMLEAMIANAANEFAKRQTATLGGDEDMEAACVSSFITGVSLTAHFIVANDGSRLTEPRLIELAAERVAASLGMDKTKLDNGD